jgi:regulatory protein YycI of two-component signal transduction system YycFG
MNFGQKMKLNQGDIKNKVKDNRHSVERQIKCKHTDKHAFSTNTGNFCDKHVKALKPAIVLYKTTLHIRDTWTNQTA